MKPKLYTTKQIAKIEGYKTDSRIRQKRLNGDYPNAVKCPCGQAWLIPQQDIDKNKKSTL